MACSGERQALIHEEYVLPIVAELIQLNPQVMVNRIYGQ